MRYSMRTLEMTGCTDSRNDVQLMRDLIQLELLMEGFGYKIAWGEQARVIRRELIRRDVVPQLHEWTAVPVGCDWDDAYYQAARGLL